MDRVEAAALLGLSLAPSDVELRDAYRRAMRAQHPDVAGVASTDAAARINEAAEILRTAPPPPEPAHRSTAVPAPPPPVTVDDSVVLVDDDTMAFSFPADEVFALLMDVGDSIGDLTYVDADAGLLEVLVHFADEPPCSVVLSLQGRADRVEAFCTIESLDGNRPPPTNEVVSLLIHRLRDRLSHRSR